MTGRGFSLAHASLSVSDLDQAMAFFGAVFGFVVVDEARGGLGGDIEIMTGVAGLDCEFAQMRAPGVPLTLELIAFHGSGETRARPDPAPARPGAGHIAFHVRDFDAMTAQMLAAGARMLGAEARWPGGRAAYFRAPGDAFVEIEATI